MATIRHARPSDVDAIVTLAQAEHAMSPWVDVPFDRAATAETVDAFISGAGRTALYSTSGGYLLGLVQPFGFARRLMAVEFAWFAQDGSGMALLSRFEEWGQAMGASGVSLHSLGGNRRLERLLSLRRGYRHVAASLFKRLGA